MQFITHLENEKVLYERLANQARLDAIDGEMKQEGKYDTRAIEASYLAGAQKRRLEEIIIEIQTLRSLSVHEITPSTTVVVGSLVCIDSPEGEKLWFYISPTSGGVDVSDHGLVKVISVQSPLARSMIGCGVGEEISNTLAPPALKASIVDTIL